ncbi:hypothetical protein HDU86_000168 [Geranomyces michiganensis]|nr:hypothetical protein HDU86_000168 [Geranomyces michiganensis]
MSEFCVIDIGDLVGDHPLKAACTVVISQLRMALKTSAAASPALKTPLLCVSFRKYLAFATALLTAVVSATWVYLTKGPRRPSWGVLEHYLTSILHALVAVELRYNSDHAAADASPSSPHCLDEVTYRARATALAKRIRPYVYRYGVGRQTHRYRYRRATTVLDPATDLDEASETRLVDAVWVESLTDVRRTKTEKSSKFKGASDRCVLYLFGGGFCYFTSETYAPGMPWIIERISGPTASVCLLESRSSPEHLFPAALDDVVATYVALLKVYQSSNIAIAGDSSGGGLALGLCARLKVLDLPMPACLAIMSPWTDLSCTSQSWTSNADLDVLPQPQGLFNIPRNYLGPDYHIIALNNSLVSPACSPKGAFEGFPPTLIQVGGAEVLLDDAKAVAEKMEMDGCVVDLQIYKDQIHFFQCFLGLTRSDFPTRALEATGKWIGRWTAVS